MKHVSLLVSVRKTDTRRFLKPFGAKLVQIWFKINLTELHRFFLPGGLKSRILL